MSPQSASTLRLVSRSTLIHFFFSFFQFQASAFTRPPLPGTSGSSSTPSLVDSLSTLSLVRPGRGRVGLSVF
jgi:hypothetical protein